MARLPQEEIVKGRWLPQRRRLRTELAHEQPTRRVCPDLRREQLTGRQALRSMLGIEVLDLNFMGQDCVYGVYRV